MAKGYSERRRSAVRVYDGKVLLTRQDNNTAIYVYGSQEKGSTDYTGVLRYTNEQARRLAKEIVRLIGE